MGWSWAGAAEWLSEKREREERLEQWEREQKALVTRALLPELMERRKAERDAARLKAAVYKKGVNLFGEEVANALENMGSLDEVVSEYKGTDADKGWAQAIVARVGDQVNGLLKSDKAEDRKLGASLLKRGALLSEADEGSKANYLTEVLADGYITYDEFLNYEPASTGVSMYAGTTPDLGKPKLYSAAELSNSASRIVAGLLGDKVDVRVNKEGKFINLANGIDPQVLVNLETDVKMQLEENQFRLGTSGAERAVIDSWPSLQEKYNLAPQGAVVNATSASETQAAMGNLGVVTGELPVEEDEEENTNGFAPGVFESVRPGRY